MAARATYLRLLLWTIAKITKLPTELSLDIAERLPQADQLVLRLTDHKFFDAVNNLVLSPEKQTRMYMRPSTIQRLITQIRANDPLTDNVTTLVILGKVAGSGEFDQADDFKYLRDRPWPQFASTSDPNMPQSLAQMVRAEATPFHVTYAPLIAALSKLSKLRTVVCTPSSEQKGLNRASQATIDAWALAHADYAGAYGGAGQPSVSHARRRVQWSDGEVLMGLLTGLTRVTDLDLHHTLHSFLNRTTRYQWLVPIGPAANSNTIRSSIWDAVGEQLCSLDCAITARGVFPDGNALATNMLCHSPQLRALTVRIDNIFEERSTGYPTSMNFLLEPECHQRLETVRILGVSALPSSLYTGAGQRNGFVDVELAREINPFSTFLQLHRKYVKSIELLNVVVCDFRGEYIASDVKDVLHYMGEMLPKLETAVVRLRQATCCESCCDYIGRPEAGQCCQARLSDHRTRPTAKIRLSLVEGLAADLEVSGQGGSWDFGEYVMRRAKEVRRSL